MSISVLLPKPLGPTIDRNSPSSPRRLRLAVFASPSSKERETCTKVQWSETCTNVQWTATHKVCTNYRGPAIGGVAETQTWPTRSGGSSNRGGDECEGMAICS